MLLESSEFTLIHQGSTFSFKESQRAIQTQIKAYTGETAVKLTVKLSLSKIKQHMSHSPCAAETQLVFGFSDSSEGSTARSNSGQPSTRKALLEVAAEGTQGGRMQFSTSKTQRSET